MTDPLAVQPTSGLQAEAQQALEAALESLLSSEEYGELREIVPDTFSADLMSIAWRHQSDLDKARFRRAVKEYLGGIAYVATAE